MKRKIVFLLLLLVIISGCGEDEKYTIKSNKIIVIAPLTGPAASYGAWIKDGIELAQSKNLEYIYLDSKGSPKHAITLAQKYVNDKGLYSFWTVTSGETKAVKGLSTGKNITVITASATSPELTQSGGVLRTIINSEQETTALVNTVVGDFKFKKAAIFYINDAGGVASRDQFEDKLKEHFTQIVGTFPFEKNPKNIRSEVVKALSLKPDMIVVTGYSRALGQVIKEIRINDKEMVILSNQGMESPENMTLPKEILTNIYYSIAKFEPKNDSFFVKAFKRKHKKEPNIYAITAYDTARIIENLWQKSKVSKDILKNSKSMVFNGENGVYAFKPSGDVKKEVSIKYIKNGNVSLFRNYNEE